MRGLGSHRSASAARGAGRLAAAGFDGFIAYYALPTDQRRCAAGVPGSRDPPPAAAVTEQPEGSDAVGDETTQTALEASLW